jgi:hypothetical protein
MKSLNQVLCGALVAGSLTGAGMAQTPPPDGTILFQNVRIFDGRSSELSAPSYVLVRGNKIAKNMSLALGGLFSGLSR